MTRLTLDALSRSTNSTIVLVEWPMVKKVLVMAPPGNGRRQSESRCLGS
jgi:hypothetical protein